jgi:hypothetical protein
MSASKQIQTKRAKYEAKAKQAMPAPKAKPKAQTKPRRSRRAKVAPGLLAQLRWIRDESLIMNDGPFEMSMVEGDNRVVVIVGENASGKSLIFRMLSQRVNADGALAVTTSIRARAEGGIASAFMYGDENEQSTGATTAKWIMAAFANNLDREGGSILGLDEPELGLSEGYARALGELVAREIVGIPSVCGGVVIVTHSRAFVEGLVAAGARKPTFVTMSAEPVTIEQWAREPDVRSVEQLLELPTVGLQRWREVNDLMRS